MAKLGDLCAAIGGKLVGPPDLEIRGVSSLEEAGPGDIAPVESDRYLKAARASKAEAFIVGAAVDAGFRRPHVKADFPLAALNRLVELLGLARCRPPPGTHPTSVVDPSAKIGADVSIGPFCVVGPEVRIGRGTVLLSHVAIEKGVTVGEACELAQGCVLHEGARLGDRVKIGAHAVIGRPGFGYAPGPNGPVHLHHVGLVVLEDDVHIGAGTAVDRARYGVTRIARHAKVDNLVQIGHNCTIGARTFLSAQTGLAGSVRLGSDCQLGGQVGIADHLRIGDGVRIAAQSGVMNNWPSGVQLFGYPAQPKRHAMRELVALRRLAEGAERRRRAGADRAPS
jgi:UDP-3-O-[3-hydroxymyristoyl] glucosamine N-acyltransferase